MANGVFKVAPFDGLIFIYQTDSVGYAIKRVFLKFIDFELYKLYCASYLCRGIGQTSCSFEHVSCWLKIAYFCYIFATPLSFGALAPYVPLGISR